MRAPGARKRTGPVTDPARDAGPLPNVVRAGVRHGERDAPDIDGGGCSAFLYDAGGEDRDVALDKAVIDGLADDDLLWVDVDSSQEGSVARVTALIPVHIESMSVTDANKPFVHGFGESFVLGVLPLPMDMAQQESEMLICAVGRNWLVTVHDGEAGARSAPTTRSACSRPSRWRCCRWPPSPASSAWTWCLRPCATPGSSGRRWLSWSSSARRSS